MKVERDIAGFALPYIVGIILTAYAGTCLCLDSSLIHIVASTVILIAVYMLIFKDERYYMPLICTAACACGIISGVTGQSIIEMHESRLEFIATGFCDRMKAAIDAIPFSGDDTGALIKALLTGDRSDLSKEISKAFRDSGASHILALSGLHLGIIYMIISKILGLIGNTVQAKKIRSLLIICICGFYTLATGAGESIVRAFIFITLNEIARMTGRHHGLKHIILASLVIQLTVSPMSIRSVSFQLSYAAMAGIAFIFPFLKEMWPEESEKKGTAPLTAVGRLTSKAMHWIWNSTALSISCQITTGPLAYLYFRSMPMYFLLTNLLSLPLTGVLIPVALLTLGCSALGWYPDMLVQATDMLTGVLIWSLEVISTM